LGDDSLELTEHVGDADPDSYSGDDYVVIRSGQDLIVVHQHTMIYGNLDPATTRVLATAAYTTYLHQP
jgi:hypothetical protein